MSPTPSGSLASLRDWHEYECAHGHLWWSAPTSTRCPVCGTTTYKPGEVAFGTAGVMVESPSALREAAQHRAWDDE